MVDTNLLVDRFAALALALVLVVAPAASGGVAALAVHFDDVPGAFVASQFDALSSMDVGPGGRS